MNIYISGISGTGMGPLALMAKAAGLTVFGSDLEQGAIYQELTKAGIEVKIGAQDGEFLQEKIATEGVDWFVYTSALPADHSELKLAQAAGIKCTKRDDFTAYLVEKLGLKMVAVAGTHGKTTTTAMITYAALKLKLPVAYIVGTTLGFAPSGAYHPGDEYFIYEADEYDRNFLKFHPWLAVIPYVSYDHPDIYPTPEDYMAAFEQFKSQSEQVITPEDDLVLKAEDFTLAGEVRREDAALTGSAVLKMLQDADAKKIIEILDTFPGVGRRFEKLADGIYSDYAHHPEEIAATLEMAQEEADKTGKLGVVAVYQPHQNQRQYEVREGYEDAFLGVERLYWLPTYLVRGEKEAAEKVEGLPVLTPEDLIFCMYNGEIAEPAELNDELWRNIQRWQKANYLVILLSAGPADGWLREKLNLA